MGQLSILVVDDDHDHADSLGELLTMQGHEVEVAYNGNAAIAAYDRRSFDLGFMDVMMPGKDGVQSFLEIKLRHPSAKIFMMTGYSVEQLLNQATNNGALGVIPKPIDIANLVDAIGAIKSAGIVVVGDESPTLGALLQTAITANAKTCELVTDGNQALDRIDRGDVEVLILDLKKPLIDGLSVYVRLRDQGKAVPTVLITECAEGLDDNSIELDLEQTGILTKPFSPEDLLNRLERMAV